MPPIKNVWVTVCALVWIGGCARITTREDFMRGGESLAGFETTPVGVVNLDAQVRGKATPHPVNVLRATGTGGSVTVNYLAETSALANTAGISLEDDPVLLKLTKAMTTDADGQPQKVTISAWEVKDFAAKVVRGLGAFDSTEAMLAEIDRSLTVDTARPAVGNVSAFTAGTGASLKTILAAYLKEYLSGRFVDRDGNELPKPKLGKTIGNDVIVGFETVLLEAIFDYAYLTPALYTEGEMEYEPRWVGPLDAKQHVTVTPTQPAGPGASYDVAIAASQKYFVQLYVEAGRPRVFNKEKKRPTFIKVLPTLVAQISTDPQSGVTALERDAIEFVGNLNALGSQQLSGLITRLFGGIHVGFVLFGKVSIGDNDTVAKAVETLAEVCSRRYLDAAGYDTFNRFIYHEHTDSAGKVTDVYLTDVDRQKNESKKISRKKGDALILLLNVQLKLHGLLG